MESSDAKVGTISDDGTFLKTFGVIFESREEKGIDMISHFLFLGQFEDQYSELPVVKRTKEAIETQWDRFILYDCCSDFLKGDESGLSSTVSCLYEGEYTEHFINLLLRGKNPLYTEGYLGIYVNGDLSTATLKLTHKARTLLLGKIAAAYLRD